MELVVVVVVIGILSGVVVNAKPWYENPLKNSQDRLNSVIKLARTRAMSSTSTYRITSSANNPNEAIQIQRIRSGSCRANTTLVQDVAATDTTIVVSDVSGFAIGDRLTVGGTAADVLSVNFGNNTITLGAAVGTKTAGAVVDTVKSWKNDGAFLDEDLNVNKKASQTDPDISLTAKFDNTEASEWGICINSRGLVSLFDDSGVVVDKDLNLVLTNTRTNQEAKVIIAPGGAMETTAIAMGSGGGAGGGSAIPPSASAIPPGGSGGSPPGGSGGSAIPPGGGGGTPEPEVAGASGQNCNQGVGNGPDGCDPGNSNNNQPSNDEGADTGPGSPGRANNNNSNGNTNGNANRNNR